MSVAVMSSAVNPQANAFYEVCSVTPTGPSSTSLNSTSVFARITDEPNRNMRLNANVIHESKKENKQNIATRIICTLRSPEALKRDLQRGHVTSLLAVKTIIATDRFVPHLGHRMLLTVSGKRT